MKHIGGCANWFFTTDERDEGDILWLYYENPLRIEIKKLTYKFYDAQSYSFPTIVAYGKETLDRAMSSHLYKPAMIYLINHCATHCLAINPKWRHLWGTKWLEDNTTGQRQEFYMCEKDWRVGSFPLPEDFDYEQRTLQMRRMWNPPDNGWKGQCLPERPWQIKTPVTEGSSPLKPSEGGWYS